MLVQVEIVFIISTFGYCMANYLSKSLASLLSQHTCNVFFLGMNITFVKVKKCHAYFV